MAQKEGKNAVWLNMVAPTRLLSITIEYDQSKGKLTSSDHATTVFTSGEMNRRMNPYDSAGTAFTAKNDTEPIFGSQVPFKISDYTVVYNLKNPLPETKAIKISTSRDMVSLSACFTDYDLSTTVRPKMSQPGMSLSFNKYFFNCFQL